MKQKIRIGFFLALITLSIAAAHSYALNLATIDRMQEKASAAADRQNTELSRIRERADTMIQVRLATLQKLLTRIQSDKKLNDDEKTMFANDVHTTINSLASLKTKIDADTDATTARADAKSIVTTYRIYVVYEPKIRLTVIIDNVQTITTTLTTLTTKIQTFLDTLNSQGKNMSSAQAALTDAHAQITAIDTLLTTDKSLLSGVTTASANPQSIFTQVRKDLATVRQDLAKIRLDFATILANLQIVLKTTPEATSSAK